MDRVVRLYQLWSWLPHFRAVAETEHLPTASEALGISPSALSRALRQLEAAVDRELFLRDGRTIRLNDHGQTLLRAVRLAMRSIDDAVSALDRDETPFSLRLAAPGPFHGALILDVIAQLTTDNPRVRAELSSCANDEIVSSLCRGVIDLCIHEGPVEHPDLESVHLATVAKRLACAPSHPLAGHRSVELAQLGEHIFVAPPANARGLREDGWPPSTPRRIGLTVTHMQTGIDACTSGRYLAILPRPVIRAMQLHELHVTDVELPTGVLLATMRRRIDTQPIDLDRLLVSLTAAFGDR